MTDNNIRIEILDEYKKVFPSYYNQLELVTGYIEKYKIDPCNHNTITNAINELRGKLDKIEIPEIIFPKEYYNEIAFAHPGFTNPKKLNLKQLKKKYKRYKGMSLKKGDAIICEAKNIEKDINILEKWKGITKYYLPEENENNENKLGYGEQKRLYKDIVFSEEFIKLKIEKYKTLSLQDKKNIKKIASKVCNKQINFNSLFSKFRREGYSEMRDK